MPLCMDREKSHMRHGSYHARGRALREALENPTGNKCWVPHCPDFLWRFVALIHSMRLSLMKGAHTGLSSAAWQEIGVKPSFGLSGIPELDVPLPVPHARPRQSEGYDPRSWLSPCAMAATRRPFRPLRM